MTQINMLKCIKEYKNRGFNNEQILEICLGFINDLPVNQVTKYAKLEYDWLKMENMRLELENGRRAWKRW